MKTHYLNSSTFYILSGPSASGKSFFTNQLLKQGLPLDGIVSTDTIRKSILGYKEEIDEHGVRHNLYGWSYNQPEIFSIIKQILEVRFKQKLPTIYDATSLSDKERGVFVELAKKHNIDSHVVIIDTDTSMLKDRLANRIERFEYSVVERQLEKFQKESIYPYSLISSGDTIVYNPSLIKSSNLVIVGDTHGMLTPLIEMLETQGFVLGDKGFEHPNKKIVFLGDVLDRGEDSLKLLNIVIQTVQNDNGYFIIGNHENKLIQSYENYLKDGTVKGKSISSSQTLMKFLSLEENERASIFNFLKSSPVCLNLWVDKNTLQASYDTLDTKDLLKFGMVHAHVNIYDPYKIPKSEAIYGYLKSEGDHDKVYQDNYNAGINQYIILRGHIKETSKQSHIFSLEDDQAFNGNLMTLDLSQFLEKLKENSFESNYTIFENAIMKKETKYNYNDTIKDVVQLMKGLTALHKEGLVTNGVRTIKETGEKVFPPDGLKIYKYAKKVHFKRLWKTNPLFEKARGIVLDDCGNLIVHPFDKIYNYEEYDTGKGIKPEHPVYCVEKLNGFLGCISMHPFRKEILLSTTGSLTSDFVDYIRDFIDDTTNAKLLNYFKDNNKTLMFEVLHAKDNENHIVPYSQEELGLWLIGARERNLKAKPDAEESLDNIAKQLGFQRPKWHKTTFEQVLTQVQDSELEGYMVRDAITQDTLMKIKTNYYLVTKFVGRMSPEKCKMMFKSPENFKANYLEEEFYSLVDLIINKTTEDNFLEMKPQDKVSFVRELVIQTRNSVADKKIIL